jgi:hypothetical protein
MRINRLYYEQIAGACLRGALLEDLIRAVLRANSENVSPLCFHLLSKFRRQSVLSATVCAAVVSLYPPTQDYRGYWVTAFSVVTVLAVLAHLIEISKRLDQSERATKRRGQDALRGCGAGETQAQGQN